MSYQKICVIPLLILMFASSQAIAQENESEPPEIEIVDGWFRIIPRSPPLKPWSSSAEFEIEPGPSVLQWIIEATLNGTDSDGDGLSDSLEIFIHGTDPFEMDTDGDAHTDGVEVSEGSDPNNPLSTPCYPGTE